MLQRGAALAALALLTVSCGGGKRLSLPELQREASTICATYAHRVNALSQPRTLADLSHEARQAAAYGRTERDALHRLAAPSDAQPQWRRLLSDLDRADALLPQVQQAAAQGNAGTVESLARQGKGLVADANANAGALNLGDCRRS